MKGRKFIWLVLLVMGFSFQGRSQWVFRENHSIGVIDNNNLPLVNSWAGGLNCPQFWSIDLNGDGKEDLVVFDRGYWNNSLSDNGDKLLTFINTGDSGTVSYQYAPQYETLFPPLNYWMELQDFNCDGIKDTFSSDMDGVDLYLGAYDNSGQLYFTYDTTLLYTPYPTAAPTAIFVSPTDIPGIADVNGDSAIDLVTFGLLSPDICYFHNLSETLTQTCGDTMDYDNPTCCWGDIYQLGATSGVFLDSCEGGIPNIGKSGNAEPRHNGNAELLFHQHTDSLEDMLLSDIYYNNIDFLRNGGTRDSAVMIYQDTAFPSYDVTINIPTFPAAYLVDVNNDGLPDLIAAPNVPNASLNLNCAWYYKNVTTNPDSVRFKFQTDTFLVNTMLDFGQGAYPSFFDYNGDGLKDIVVGNYGYFAGEGEIVYGVGTYNYTSGLALLQNAGTADSPDFKLVTRDYGGLSKMTYNGNPVLGLTPTFGDLNGDNKVDMIVGNYSGRLHYFQNTSTNDTAQFTLMDSNFMGIDVSNNYIPDSVETDYGGFSAPFLYDVNGDGLLDLIVGRYPGNVYYYQNYGSPTSPMFSSIPTNNFFGQIDVRAPGFLTGYSCPIITRLNSSNSLYVLVGNERGRIVGYLFDTGQVASGGMFEKVFDTYSNIHEGERTAVTVADIDNSGKMSMVVGNYRGGLSFFKQIDSVQSGIADVAGSAVGFSIYPDPVNEILNVKSDVLLPVGSNIVIMDMLGRKMMMQETGPSQMGQVTSINVQALSPGLYICLIQTGQGAKALEFMKK